MKVRLIIKTKREYYDMSDPMMIDDYRTAMVEMPKEYFYCNGELVGIVVGAEIIGEEKE